MLFKALLNKRRFPTIREGYQSGQKGCKPVDFGLRRLNPSSTINKTLITLKALGAGVFSRTQPSKGCVS